MSTLLLLTPSTQSSIEVLPALALLPHQVKILPPEASALLDAPSCDAVLIDGRTDLAQARGLTRLLKTTGVDAPLVLIVTEGGLAVVAADWGMDDVILTAAGPAEVEARLRLAIGRVSAEVGNAPDAHVIKSGGLTVDDVTYTAKLDGRSLDLTFKEFELLKFLAQHPGRVFTRQQLLQEVWGYDYFGGTRTVDVHVRRLRAKLGPDNETLIGTVRNVGYRFVAQSRDGRRETSESGARSEAEATDESERAAALRR
ncbi:DNA-binding response OmpR family regulator [Mumia flava]|uniref:DNA-binding response OmpR family regulator n=1 Tax=Mumia flava TaxID=1348852 RepID=A0A0B2BPJ5_9ACTN|nr:response regulator transcription factor [Mumia flava]PJJ57146.1 DNA-binding response OmpR family regulator [Mumia flava]